MIEHHTEYIADYCRNVLLLKDGHVEWKLPVGEALGRVEAVSYPHLDVYKRQV